MRKYFYGNDKQGPYFEGWYFRCQAQDGHAIAFIPAFHILADGTKYASLQVITEEQAWWLEYPANAFAASEKFLYIQLGECCFSEDGLQLDVERDGLSLHGSVSFTPFHILKSDIMGPFRWLSNMECAHSVISMGHGLSGSLELNGDILNLNRGRGYIEGDRGSSFPTEYLWTQCMWDNCSLMLSIATIPFGKLSFTGCICAIILDGKEYRFATYRGARIQNWSDRGAVICQGKYRLEVQLLEQNAQQLRAPSEGNMNRTVHESMCATVRYRFWRGGELMFDHIDTHAGYEYANM